MVEISISEIRDFINREGNYESKTKRAARSKGLFDGMHIHLHFDIHSIFKLPKEDKEPEE